MGFAPGDRIIMHLDMDAFFAAVEELDNPGLRGKPVIVGANPKHGRGVVSTANYAARKFGLHSAQPISEAFRMCPHGVFLPPRFARYKELSDKVFAILESVSPAVQPVSIDEAFVDLSGLERLFGDPIELARRVKQRIYDEILLVASVGVAPNKYLAKLASDHDKPDGFVIIEPDRVREFLDPLPVGELWGVGPVTRKSLEKLGIKKVKDLSDSPCEVLEKRFGEYGIWLWKLSNGIDERPVSHGEGRVGISKETTFMEDVDDEVEKISALRNLADRLATRMRKKGISGRTITVKIRYTGFTTITRSDTLLGPISTSDELFREALRLARPELEGSIRLLGIRLSSLTGEGGEQLPLFNDLEIERTKRLEHALDEIQGKFGREAIGRARRMRPKDRDTD